MKSISKTIFFLLSALLLPLSSANAQEPFKCQFTQEPKGSISSLSLIQSADSSQCTSTEPRYVIGDEVPIDQREMVRNVFVISIRYFCSRTSLSAGGFSVFAFTDFEKLLAAYSQWFSIPVDQARQHWNNGTGWAISGSNGIFFNMRNIGSNFNAALEIASHEYFHIIQGALAKDFIGAPNNQVPKAGPRWLIEGSANFASALCVDDARSNSFANIKDGSKRAALSSSAALSSIETWDGMIASNFVGYQLGFMACDFMTPSSQPRSFGLHALVSFWDAIGKGSLWQDAFQSAFGMRVDQFYQQFEFYRQNQFVLFPSSCNLLCDVSVPITASAAIPIALNSTARLSGCSGSPIFNWNFGDGSPHSNQRNASHVFTRPGTYTWIMTTSVTTATACQKSGTIGITESVSPSIFSVEFDGKKNLTIEGMKFGSNPRVIINNGDRTDKITSFSDTLIRLKGKRKKLGFKSGDNTIQVFDMNGLGSNVVIIRL